MHRRRAWSAVLALLALSVAASCTATVPELAPSPARPRTPAPPPPAYSHYVALGDSFTAGPGIPRQVGAEGCGRSGRNYPSLLAERLDVESFTDVSCNGADTTHLRGAQRTGDGRVVPQLGALTRNTDLVTLGIGGNDFAVFGQLVTLCPLVRGADPAGAPCRAFFGQDGADALLDSVPRLRDRLVRALSQIMRRAPGADVVLVGYPRIVPVRGTCPGQLPFAERDYRYADRVERALNATLRRAAQSQGAVYVDTFGPSRGHDVCAGPRAWVNGRAGGPTAAAYHPFARGMAGVAREVHAALPRR
ncbi:MAG: SGNH/GDSL hydrolase family protein [Actinomycetota bacterium]|nr:SGNH/GDSL hydrolase family protein [Actinomycetota bacterium]